MRQRCMCTQHAAAVACTPGKPNAGSPGLQHQCPMAINYMTTREAAAVLGTSVRTIQQWVEKGLLEGWKTEGGHRRIASASVTAALRARDMAEEASQMDAALSVLIVEDDASLLKLYRLQLRSWPFETRIYSAPNGYEALVLMGEVRPDLLVCDLRLPGVNGFQVVRALCEMERFKKLVIVVISGLPEAEIKAHGGLPDRVCIMGKPINFGRLQEIARERWGAKQSATDPG